MPYSSVGSFTDGDVLSASDLNGIRSNQEYFQSSLGNTSGVSFVAADTLLDGIYGTWIFKRRRRYLHWRIDVLTGDTAELDILIDGNSEFNDGTNRTSGYSYTGYVDLTATTANPSIGDFYEVQIDIEHQSPSGGTTRIWYFLESDSTSL